MCQIDGGNRGRRDEGKRGQRVCTEIMIYSEEVHSSPVCNAGLHAVRKYLPGAEALEKHSVTNE